MLAQIAEAVGRLPAIFNRASGQTSISPRDAEAMESLFGVGPKSPLTSAQRHSVVLTCIRILSEDLAKLPVYPYERLSDGGRRKAEKHPLYRVLKIRPNMYQSPFMFWEMVESHLNVYGNFYAEIQRNGYGDIIGLWPIMPWNVTDVTIDAKTGKKMYNVQLPNKPVRLYDYDVLHIMKYSADGIIGESPIRQHARMIGVGIKQQAYQDTLLDNMARPSGTLNTTGQLSDPARANLKKQWADIYAGYANAGKVPVLEHGLEFKPITLNPKELEFIDQMKFNALQICMVFRVPPHKIGIMDRATQNNFEQQQQEYYSDTLGGEIVRIENTMETQLLTESEQMSMFIEFKVDARLRGDFKTRMEGYKHSFYTGMMTINDMRRLENLNPVDDEMADAHLVPANMMPLANMKHHAGGTNISGQGPED
jgi:HK97 family phage portal protein